MSSKAPLSDCLWCATTLDQPERGGKRKTCSDACRVAVLRWRRKSPERQLALLRRATDAGYDEARMWASAYRNPNTGQLEGGVWERIAPHKASPLIV